MSKTVGDYVLKEKIGKGSYADVYRGTHKVTGLKYAIKAISKEILSEPKLLAGLESEIKIMREFSHKNIVCLHEYFSSEKNFYLVLELCEGGDLSKFIRKKKRLDERLAHNFLTQITSGLAFLHERNFIHRDLKPANVLLNEFSDNAVLKLADFGFARQLSVASLAQTRCGTPLYMAPEILESRDYDGKADVWSVGCIFYEMLVGTSPFKGMNEGDLLMNIKTKELNVPKEVVLSKVSIEILIKLLERQPIRRASLPQLVALCTHLSSTMPATATATSAPDDSDLQLPLPSPSSAADVRSPEMTHSRRPPLGDTPDAGGNRRRFSSAADATEAAFDPNYVSPARAHTGGGRNYAGGPAPSNLHGMLDGGNANMAFAGTPQKSTSATPSQSHDGAHGGNTSHAGRRHSTGAIDPQVSRTLRAPYAAGPSAQKYPSPSSSPPTGYGAAATTAASAVGGFLQSVASAAPVTASHVASSSSGSAPATGTMGMVGNLIAYVFNPSPSPSPAQADASRSYGAGAQGRYHNHNSGRTVSSDRAVPPSFGGGAFAGGNGGAVTPPPGSAAKGRPQQPSSSDRRIREDHFAQPEAIDGGYVSTRSPKHALGNGSTSMEDDDFVLINKSASDMDRRSGGQGHHGSAGGAGYRYVPPGSTSVSSSSSGGTSTSTTITAANSATNSFATGAHHGPGANQAGVGIGGIGASGVPPGAARHAAMMPVEYNMEYDAHANELAAVQAFYASLVQRCQVYSAVVAAITALGDHYVREGQAPGAKAPPRMTPTHSNIAAASKSTATAVSDEDEDYSIAGFLQPGADLLSPFAKQVTVERHLVACSLYLHALGILTRLMKSFENNDVMEQPELKQALPMLKQPLTAAFDQLIARAETCQKHIDSMVNPDGGAGGANAGTGKYVMPQPEPIMLQAALQREADAGPEELLGNLAMACKLYQSAYDLVEGVALTAHDPEDQRKLYAYSASLLERLTSCKLRAAELFHYNS